MSVFLYFSYTRNDFKKLSGFWSGVRESSRSLFEHRELQRPNPALRENPCLNLAGEEKCECVLERDTGISRRRSAPP